MKPEHSSNSQTNSHPEQRVGVAPRPPELRYRIADSVNDLIHSIPVVHRTLKTIAHRLAFYHRKFARSEAPTLEPENLIAIADEIPAGRRNSCPNVPPYPPLEMRELVGPTDLAAFDNPAGGLVYPWLPEGVYENVFDFGCGCGRVARQLMLQKPSPKHYVGIDLHSGMIRWCQANLKPIAPHFQFRHHDVFNVRFNPGSDKPMQRPFPLADCGFTLVNALSVFTHLTQQQAAYYLRECARILHPEGLLHASWFLFDKADYPMLQLTDAALYVSYIDPSAAVIFDRAWVRQTARELGLTICKIIAPQVHGHQWLLIMTKRTGAPEAEFPADSAPKASVPPPVGSRPDANKIGLE